MSEEFLAGRTGLALASRPSVDGLGLGTASPCNLLIAYGSGVRAPTEATRVASFRPGKRKSPHKSEGFFWRDVVERVGMHFMLETA